MRIWVLFMRFKKIAALRTRATTLSGHFIAFLSCNPSTHITPPLPPTPQLPTIMESLECNVLLVGQIYLDTILNVPHFPEEDHKLRATRMEQRRGGNTANTAVGNDNIHEDGFLIVNAIIRKSLPSSQR